MIDRLPLILLSLSAAISYARALLCTFATVHAKRHTRKLPVGALEDSARFTTDAVTLGTLRETIVAVFLVAVRAHLETRFDLSTAREFARLVATWHPALSAELCAVSAEIMFALEAHFHGLSAGYVQQQIFMMNLSAASDALQVRARLAASSAALGTRHGTTLWTLLATIQALEVRHVSQFLGYHWDLEKFPANCVSSYFRTQNTRFKNTCHTYHESRP